MSTVGIAKSCMTQSATPSNSHGSCYTTQVAIAKHNQILKAEKEAEIRRQQEEDLALLNAMLEKERLAEEAEQTYKAQLKAQVCLCVYSHESLVCT
jgi:hypothetical protein